jgi:crossover junction endodeoxyribonuclease RusA
MTSDSFSKKILVLPYPPSVNTYWRRGPRSTYLSKKGKEYRKEVIAFKQMNDQLFKPLTCDIKLEAFAFPPTNHKRDVDNIAKSLLDSLDHAGYYVDDVQIKDLRLRMLEKKAPGYVIVRMTPLVPLSKRVMKVFKRLIENSPLFKRREKN